MPHVQKNLIIDSVCKEIRILKDRASEKALRNLFYQNSQTLRKEQQLENEFRKLYCSVNSPRTKL